MIDEENEAGGSSSTSLLKRKRSGSDTVAQDDSYATTLGVLYVPLKCSPFLMLVNLIIRLFTWSFRLFALATPDYSRHPREGKVWSEGNRRTESKETKRRAPRELFLPYMFFSSYQRNADALCIVLTSITTSLSTSPPTRWAAWMDTRTETGTQVLKSHLGPESLVRFIIIILFCSTNFCELVLF